MTTTSNASLMVGSLFSGARIVAANVGGNGHPQIKKEAGHGSGLLGPEVALEVDVEDELEARGNRRGLVLGAVVQRDVAHRGVRAEMLGQVVEHAKGAAGAVEA